MFYNPTSIQCLLCCLSGRKPVRDPGEVAVGPGDDPGPGVDQDIGGSYYLARIMDISMPFWGPSFSPIPNIKNGLYFL